MSKWTNEYYNLNQTKVNYQPIGSGGGIRQIYSRTVLFAASDKPLSTHELRQHKLIQFPAIVGGIVPVINIKGVKANQLILSGRVLAEIYLGKITYWNDPKIQNLNPSIKLPHAMILSIHRADGSGTTYNFANYLAKVSSDWKNNVGVNTTLKWPGNGVGAKGNAGVAAQVQNLPNSIGYVEYAYAHESGLTTTKLINKAGKAIAPSLSTFKAAAASAKWSPKQDYQLILTNQPGANSWPINASTFILLPTDNTKVQNQAILKFFHWTYTNNMARNITKNTDYVSIPTDVVKQIEHYWMQKLQYTFK
jgi:phosphate transport system substrate-binding protein